MNGLDGLASPQAPLRSTTIVLPRFPYSRSHSINGWVDQTAACSDQHDSSRYDSQHFFTDLHSQPHSRINHVSCQPLVRRMPYEMIIDIILSIRRHPKLLSRVIAPTRQHLERATTR